MEVLRNFLASLPICEEGQNCGKVGGGKEQCQCGSGGPTPVCDVACHEDANCESTAGHPICVSDLLDAIRRTPGSNLDAVAITGDAAGGTGSGNVAKCSTPLLDQRLFESGWLKVKFRFSKFHFDFIEKI